MHEVATSKSTIYKFKHISKTKSRTKKNQELKNNWDTSTNREILPQSGKMKQNMYCNYTFLIELKSNVIPFGNFID